MNERSAGGTKNYKQDIREVVKYYFADFYLSKDQITWIKLLFHHPSQGMLQI